MARAGRNNGFTLIEMLIAMTLLGVMVVLLFSSLRIAAESWNAGEAKTVAVNKKSVVYQFFKNRFSTIKPLLTQYVENADEGGLNQPVFLGLNNRLRFVAALPTSSARKGLQVFDITVTPNDGQDYLTMKVALSPYLQTEAAPPETVVLLDHIKQCLFSYYGNKNLESSGEWQEEWLGTEQLPQLIKVQILLDDDSFWPNMVFPVKINSQVTSSVANNHGE